MKRSTSFVIAAVAALGLGAIALPVIAQQAQMPFAKSMGGAAAHGAMGNMGAMGAGAMGPGAMGPGANMGAMGGNMGNMGNMGMMGSDQHMAAYDTDGDGTLSADEIAAGIKAELVKYDTDANGTLSLDEFAAMQADMQAETLRMMAVRAFQMHDSDGDAQVTEAEMTALATQMQQMLGQQGGMPGMARGPAAMQGTMGKN